jgi:hypothetical protein
LQLTFLPYFPYHFTIFFSIFQIFSLCNYRKYGRKVSWNVKWYGIYGRKLWNDMENIEERQGE